MSSFYQAAFHPHERRIRKAMWLDDYFGRHRYGVRFDEGGPVFSPEDVAIPLDRVFVEDRSTGGKDG